MKVLSSSRLHTLQHCLHKTRSNAQPCFIAPSLVDALIYFLFNASLCAPKGIAISGSSKATAWNKDPPENSLFDDEGNEIKIHTNITFTVIERHIPLSMDAADLFRQAQSFVNRAREAKSFRRESSHESDDHSPRIAHTLTACCRCRQVCVAMAQSSMLRVCTDC